MSDKTTMQKDFKLDQAFMNNDEKHETAFLSLEDYDYDMLNMQRHYSGVFRGRTLKINK